MNTQQITRTLGGILFLFYATFAQASAKEANKQAETSPAAQVSQYKTPHQVVEQVTQDLVGVVSNGKQALVDDPQKYFRQVRAILESAVDFQYIARNVMGAKHWKEATDEQKRQFVEVFTSGLIETYAKGMANFADFEITLQPPERDVVESTKVEVVQNFKGPQGVNRVSYTMGRRKTGEWKLINVVLDGVNLGKTLRAQFSRSVSEANGDLDAAIKGWTWKA